MITDFVPTDGQRNALQVVEAFLASDEVVAVLTGFAGSGKTTCLKAIAASRPHEILCPTGKASIRVREATGLTAQTIHRFLYTPSEDPKTGAPLFDLKDFSELEYCADKLVIVDEASMVSREVWKDLYDMAVVVGYKILLVGDTFQLPPISKDPKDKFSSLELYTPFKAHLSEVVRQALDSPIIRASMLLRSNRPDNEAMSLLTAIGESKLVAKALEVRAKGGVIICHTNKRRHALNDLMRKELGYGADLEKNEPLLVVQNNYKLDRMNGEVVSFGGWNVVPTETLQIVALDRYTQSSMEMQFGVGTVEAAECMLGLEEVAGKTDKEQIGTGAMRRAAKNAWLRIGDPAECPPYLHCNFGYALTAHKSQGSEFPVGLVVLEDSLQKMPGRERKRWAYTSLTRFKYECAYVYLKE